MKYQSDVLIDLKGDVAQTIRNDDFQRNTALQHCCDINRDLKVARLDFLEGYLPSLSINYVGMSKDMEKRLPQLYYIKMKISYDLGFIAIGVAMAT